MKPWDRKGDLDKKTPEDAKANEERTEPDLDS
jgi:hypothetical protein